MLNHDLESLVYAYNHVVGPTGYCRVGQSVRNPRGYHGEWSPKGGSREYSIHHERPEGFSQIFILMMYWTSSCACADTAHASAGKKPLAERSVERGNSNIT